MTNADLIHSTDAPRAAWQAAEVARLVADTALQARKAIGLLTEDEVAAILQLTSTGTLATWRGQKVGPAHVKLGKRVFYTVNQIGAWINEVALAKAA